MSLSLLKKLNGNRSGNLKKFIDPFEGKKEPQICWYPSAGRDFRPLLYLSPQYINKFPETGDEPKMPDIFLFTDYFPWQDSDFLDKKIEYEDADTKITILSIEELPSLNLEIPENIVNFPGGSSATNKVVFIKVEVDSVTLGKIVCSVIYAFAVNESFCAKVLLLNSSLISHVIHIRYGGGCGGGGKAKGGWLLNVIERLQCQLLITDNQYHWQEGDSNALQTYPILSGNPDGFTKTTIRTISSYLWSGYGDVNWDLIKINDL
jgi:hypothetical protein